MNPPWDASTDLLLLSIALLALLPLAPLGLALLNTGLGRSRSAAQSLLGALCILAAAGIAWWAFGFSLEGLAAGPGHAFTAAGHRWDWIATRPLLLHGMNWSDPPAACAVVFQFFAVGLAALIPWGTGA